jgi:hypothetical protein
VVEEILQCGDAGAVAIDGLLERGNLVSDLGPLDGIACQTRDDRHILDAHYLEERKSVAATPESALQHHGRKITGQRLQRRVEARSFKAVEK